MTRRLTALALSFALLAPASAALAEGWTIHDFGVMPSRDACLSRAEKVLSAYIGAHGGVDVSRMDWVVYGWDLTPGDQDVAILCPVLPDGSYYSFLIIHGGTDNDSERENTANYLADYWN